MTKENYRETLSESDRALYDAAFGPAQEGWYHGGKEGAWDVVGKFAKFPMENPEDSAEHFALMQSPVVKRAIEDAGAKIKDIGALLDKIIKGK